MLKHDDNVRITRVGPDTPMGNVFRRYWIPAVLISEVAEPDCDPVRVTLLGEDLVAFRDSKGKVSLMDAYCPHRRAPMYFGRNEDCGLRCVYHGWKFDTEGNCTDLPNEPTDSNFKDKVKIKTYPCYEAGGIVWTYMGPKEHQPSYPDYEWTRAPHTHISVSKTLENCNYLQAIEGGIDTSHSSFAHNNNLSDKNSFRQRSTAPKLEVEKTPYGFQYVGVRDLKEDGNYVRVYQFLMPSQQVRGMIQPLGGESSWKEHIPMIAGHIWVPIDDVTCYIYNFMFSVDPEKELSPALRIDLEARLGRGVHDFLPGYPAFRLKQNKDNDYYVNRDVQKTLTFTGIRGINTQDFAIQEGMGPICDRTQERLCSSDIAIIACRQLLLEAANHVENGQPLRGTDPEVYRGVSATDQILPKDIDWKVELKDQIVAKW